MLNLIVLALISILPIFELRFAIPFGVLILGINPFITFLICVIFNILIGILIYFLLDFLILLARKIKILDNIYQKKVLKIQKTIHPQVEKFGWIALALFIGIPIPLSGVYTGALAAKVIGMNKREFIVSCIVGVLIAGVIMLLLSIFFSETLNMMGVHLNRVDTITRLFEK